MRSAAVLALMLSFAPLSAASTPGGVVFEDRNGDGLRQAEEPGVAGVVVARGATLVETGEDGRYQLPEEGPTRFVVLTRPTGYDCERWYRAEAGDFALRARVPDGSSFVFAHISDVHISDRVSDFAQFAVPSAIARMPRWLGGIAMHLSMRFQNPDYSKREVTRVLRAALSPYRDVSRMGHARVMGEWIALLAGMSDDDPRSDWPIDPVVDFEASLAELRSLSPRFLVSTGDMVLESNDADAPAVDRWMTFYRARMGANGLPVYNTIGNNEIAGTSNPELRPGDPGYGKALFRAHFGPTYYSFDRGDLHFVALDTHVLVDRQDGEWDFRQLGDDVRAWLEADLAHHAGRPIVVLNHEPLVGDRSWSAALRKFSTVDADVAELLEQRGVRWTLAGHVHINGLTESGTRADGSAATQHIVTGALSGMRWSFPAEVSARGYRLFQVRDKELYSVWKATGAPVLGFLEPNVDAALHATAPHHSPSEALPSRHRVVVASADTAGPFVSLDIRIAGRPLAIERWSSYFAAAWYDTATLEPGEHELVAEATRADGSVLRARTIVSVPEPVESAP